MRQLDLDAALCQHGVPSDEKCGGCYAGCISDEAEALWLAFRDLRRAELDKDGA